MKRIMYMVLVAAFVIFYSNQANAILLFSEDFQGDLSAWTGKNQGTHYGEIVVDPLDPTGSNRVLHFTKLDSYGDIFTTQSFTSQIDEFRLSFDYLGDPTKGGVPDNLGGFVGYSLDFPGTHDWVAGTKIGYPITAVHLLDTGNWIHVETYFPDTYTSPIHLMLEDWIGSGGAAGDVYFDNIVLENPHAPVPEPATMLLLGSGLAGLGFGRFRKRTRP